MQSNVLIREKLCQSLNKWLSDLFWLSKIFKIVVHIFVMIFFKWLKRIRYLCFLKTLQSPTWWKLWIHELFRDLTFERTQYSNIRYVVVLGRRSNEKTNLKSYSLSLAWSSSVSCALPNFWKDLFLHLLSFWQITPEKWQKREIFVFLGNIKNLFAIANCLVKYQSLQLENPNYGRPSICGPPPGGKMFDRRRGGK